ncbi:zinc-binding dehydrogenase [Amycolatopsis acidiphila]|uniref:Zinc-binding dehydrogenase n=1 Tax=Amycolatopsis acidiphila TaxID=715473 RepID=A0A558A8A8_9PSEU|nr:zinc-binding dehydrogenase [Amycolatopsis acidiphila]TVT20495.1 zinc-binding dehydrogenase [Amycolatopsis acidiphila]UIJ57020.1 zinc-binding dehydrogenase [Amycolatopsis acidiphila]GHG53803.1 quinone oxidoreductase [Amycolatopsis acidiphila]
MKAVQAVGAGGPEVLKLVDVAVPEPGPDDVQIAVRFAGVNFADVNARRGTYLPPDAPPRGLGLDCYGEVTAVGRNVRELRPGQRVAGFATTAGYAQVVVTPATLVWPVPDGVRDETAAAFPVVGHTAYHLLATAARLQPGESVLVTAAAGGVGTTAVQVARLLGAGRVVAAAGSAARAAEAGADVSVGYSRLDPGNAGRIAIALDGVGGAVRRHALDCLGLFGRLVHFGNSCGEPEELPPLRELRERELAVCGLHLQRLRRERPDLLAHSAQALLGWLASGRLRIPVAEVLPLEHAAEAHRKLESRQVKGKLLLAVDGSKP